MVMQELHLPPRMSELSLADRKLIDKTRQIMAEDPWYKRAGYAQDVQVDLMGFVFSRDSQGRKRAVPVYLADGQPMAAEHHLKDNSYTSWRVLMTRVFLDMP